MNVRLSPQQERFLHRQLDEGNYVNASEVIREGLRLLMEVHQTKAHAKASASEAPSESEEPHSSSPLERFVVDCVIALALEPKGGVKLRAIHRALERRLRESLPPSVAQARVEVAFDLLEAGKAIPGHQVVESGDESGLGVPISSERWERIFGTKDPR